jgi:1-acyl-sn-glycerol-3-phosphate acyltransferase
VPPAALGLSAALVWAATDSNGSWICLLLGLAEGFLVVPFRTAFPFAIPADARGNGMALINAANSSSLGLVWLLLFVVARIGMPMPAGQPWVLATLAAAGALLAWRVFLREAIEQLGESMLWPMYRVRVRGPGRGRIPLRGPLLVIANHAAWFDPLWLAKVLPRCVTPMMTSVFFDLPILHWLMSKVAGAIRVPEAAFRRQAPELQEAVNALDRGDCVLIFPEGAMKRSPEQSLRQFGQGVWLILRQRPQTPVVVCWIEGGWGSFTSYSGGPPAVNKHLDCWRPIEIAMEAPQVLDAALLADQRASRTYLMRACLRARRYLELQPLPLQPGAGEPLESTSHYEQA